MQNQYHVVEVNPTLDTSAYASGDRVGSLMTITGVGESGSGCVLDKVVIVDQAKQSSALKILLFNAAPTIASADNAAIDITDAEMIAKCIGVIDVPSASYVALANNSVVDVAYARSVKAPAMTMYALLVSAGSPTYAASSLRLKFHFSWE